jgi:integrase
VYWSAIWIDGERRMRSLETPNRRKAEILENRWKDELHTRRFQLPQLRPDMLFGELYGRFLAEGDVKPYHKQHAKKFLEFFSEMPIGKITKNDIARYRKLRHEDHWRTHTKAGKPLSETTVNRDVEVVRRMLYWATDEGFIPANPIARVRLVRERRTRRPVMSVAEEVKLLAASSKHLRPIVIAALDTGMRRGELLNQRWEDLDFDRKLISVTHSKTPEGEQRLIPMTDRLMELLMTMRKPSGIVFTYETVSINTIDGRPVREVNEQPIRRIKTAWAGALRRAQIPHYRFHDLRHTFNSRLAEIGIIADVRKAVMGHSGGGDVHSIYTHIELPTIREALRRLEIWHKGKLSALETPPAAPEANGSRTTTTSPTERNSDESTEPTETSVFSADGGRPQSVGQKDPR